MSWDLAQLDIGRLPAPTDHPDSKGVTDALDPVNAAMVDDDWTCSVG